MSAATSLPLHGPAQAAAAGAANSARGKVPPEYRDAVDAAVGLLAKYRELARTREIGALADELWQDWRELWRDAFDCVLELERDPDALTAAKRYTEAQLTPELIVAPLWRQAYTKPRGYSGDYLVMNYIYERRLEGDSPFARLAHALACRIGEFVVRRKDLLRDAIADTVLRHGGTGGITMASIGCGPAREIAEFVAYGAGIDQPLAFTLVDHDEDALRFAGQSVAQALERRPGAPALRTDLRKVSALRLIRDVHPRELLGEVDMIYSAGLFDYFSDRTCRKLARRLFEALRPGGLMVLGNMKAGTDMFWPLYLIADWALTYRSAESVMSWAEGLPDAEISLRTEATGYDYMLSVRKGA